MPASARRNFPDTCRHSRTCGIRESRRERSRRASALGEYSTAFATYYAELRIGGRICDKLFIGPDASVDGDTGYDAQRLGGYAKYSFEPSKGVSAELTLLAGHQFVSGSGSTGFGGGAGTYGTIEISTDF